MEDGKSKEKKLIIKIFSKPNWIYLKNKNEKIFLFLFINIIAII
jgi:hypothetical protein